MEELRLEARDRRDWREWLEKNHGSDVVVWLILYRRSCDECAMSFPEALEEAIRFGWIDSRMRTFDSERHLVRFTRRKSRKGWSLRNLRTAKRLIEEGRMLPSGSSVLPEDINEEIRLAEERELQELLIPQDLAKALDQEGILEEFQHLSPSNRRAFHRWVVQAKKAETRQERVKQVVAMVSEKKVPKNMNDWKAKEA